MPRKRNNLWAYMKAMGKHRNICLCDSCCMSDPMRLELRREKIAALKRKMEIEMKENA